MISNAAYQYTLRSDSLEDLKAWAPRVLEEVRGLHQLLDVSSDQQNKGQQALVQIDRSTASRLGISTQLIDEHPLRRFRPGPGRNQLHPVKPVLRDNGVCSAFLATA